MTQFDRRSLLEMLAVLIGATAVPAEALVGPGGPMRDKPRLLDQPTTDLVTAVADTLLPRTDTPGAVAAGVPATFDALLRDWASPARRAGCLAALAAIDAAARAQGGTGAGFAALPAERRQAVLADYDRAHLAADPDYAMTKDLLVALYYLSEPGATQELRYEHAPGAWEASIPLTAQTRAWAGA